jgi:amidase
MSDIWRLSASELAARVNSREVSAREAAQAALDRLDAVNPAINAVVDYRPEDVLAQAELIDTAISRGEAPGILAGVPVTVKVNVDQAGYATTNGVTLQRGLIAQSDNPVVSNLRKAGAILLGRTNAPAFSYRWFTTRSVIDARRFFRRRGSSGGLGHWAFGARD